MPFWRSCCRVSSFQCSESTTEGLETLSTWIMCRGKATTKRSDPNSGGCKRHRGNQMRQLVDTKRQRRDRLRHPVDRICVSLARSSVGSRGGNNECFEKECELCKADSDRPGLILASRLRQWACLCDVRQGCRDSGSAFARRRGPPAWRGPGSSPSCGSGSGTASPAGLRPQAEDPFGALRSHPRLRFHRHRAQRRRFTRSVSPGKC